MVKYKTILKVIEQETNKCSPNKEAYSIGESAKIKMGKSIDETGEIYEYIEEITYKDGTTITFNDSDKIMNLKHDNFNANHMLNNDSYEFFNDQKQEIIKKYGKETYDLFETYCDKWASSKGMIFNQYLRKEIGKKELKQKLGAIFPFMYDNYPLFKQICTENNLGRYEDFFTIRYMNNLHNTDSINRNIVWDKGETSATCGFALTEGTKVEGKEVSVFANMNNHWKVITLYKKGNKGHGIFMGNALNSKRSTKDWEREIHTPSQQKFRRTIIDIANKIIIQEPI